LKTKQLQSHSQCTVPTCTSQCGRKTQILLGLTGQDTTRYLVFGTGRFVVHKNWFHVEPSGILGLRIYLQVHWLCHDLFLVLSGYSRF